MLPIIGFTVFAFYWCILYGLTLDFLLKPDEKEEKQEGIKQIN